MNIVPRSPKNPDGNRLCLCLEGRTMKENLSVLREAGDSGLLRNSDLLEIRLDLLFQSKRRDSVRQNDEEAGTELLTECKEILERELRFRQMGGIILAARRIETGGVWDSAFGEEGFRLALLERCGTLFSRFAPCFLEWEADRADTAESRRLTSAVKVSNCRLIYSFHCAGPIAAEDVLDSAEKILEETEAERPVIKMSLPLDSSSGLAAFCHLLEGVKKLSADYIVWGIGEYGIFSRVLTPHLGNLWTVCKVRTGLAGELELEQLCRIYRYRELRSSSRIFGLIGKPVSHSKSMQIHNSYYDKYGWDAVYLPFLSDRPGDVFYLSRILPIGGFSCTIPHKETVVPLLEEQSGRVQTIRACNTVYRKLSASGAKVQWVGDNTDVLGFLAPFRRYKISLKGEKVAVIGAGGAARAVLYGLLQEGAECALFNRSRERAEQLASDFLSQAEVPVFALKRGEDIDHTYNMIIQTTSVGMDGRSDPIPLCRLDGKKLVYDLIYEPSETVLLQRAKKSVHFCLNGLEMLESQASLQIQYFGMVLSEDVSQNID